MRSLAGVSALLPVSRVQTALELPLPQLALLELVRVLPELVPLQVVAVQLGAQVQRPVAQLVAPLALHALDREEPNQAGHPVEPNFWSAERPPEVAARLLLAQARVAERAVRFAR